jgi:hypothetical protein
MYGSCSGHPGFYRVTHRYPRKYYIPANWAIENAYPNKSKVFFGSQFTQGGGFGTNLPNGFGGYSSSEIAVLNQFLNEFRGLENQLQPDIIDFGDRVFYEIKTERFRTEGLRQLTSYYRTANVITQSLGILDFDSQRATWYPPATLPLPGNPGKIVCTEQTNHNTSPTGLLLYSIWKPPKDDDEDDSTRSAVMLTSLSPSIISDLRRMLAKRLQDASTFQPSGDYEILAPKAFMEGLAAAAQMQRTLQLLSGPSAALRDSVYMGHITASIAGVPSTIAAASILLAVATGGVSIAAEGGVAAGLAAGELGISSGLIDVIALGKAVNDNAIPIVAAAAGFLLVTFFASKASASELKISGVDGIILARSADVTPSAPYAHNRPVTFRGRDYLTIGHAVAL